jgi:hypothetical protein
VLGFGGFHTQRCRPVHPEVGFLYKGDSITVKCKHLMRLRLFNNAFLYVHKNFLNIKVGTVAIRCWNLIDEAADPAALIGLKRKFSFSYFRKNFDKIFLRFSRKSLRKVKKMFAKTIAKTKIVAKSFAKAKMFAKRNFAKFREK